MNSPENALGNNGSAAAATLASGIGCLAMGIFTVVTETVESIGHLLNFYNPTGNLSGKTVLAVLVWLISWAF